jgi:hypothetical protein
MAITTTARRRVHLVRDGVRTRAIRNATESLRSFAEIEPDPAGQRALRQAADALTQVHLAR